MKLLNLSLAVAVGALLLATPALAQGSFCDGFKAGFQATLRNHRAVGVVPVCPTSINRTYAAGYEAGVLAALQRIGR